MIDNLKRAARSDFARHGALVFAATSAINGLGFVYHSAISRRIGVEPYGILAALNAAYMIGNVFAVIAGTVVIKYAAEFRATGNDGHLRMLVRRISRYGLFACVAVCLFGVAIAPSLAAFLRVSNSTAVAICIATIAISGLTQVIRAIFTGVEDFGQFAISAVLESGLKAALGIGAVYAGYGVIGAFAGWCAGSFGSLVYTMGFLLRRYRHLRDVPLLIDARRLLQTMAGVAAASLLLTSLSYSDVIVYKHFADPTTAGLYAALALAGKILMFLVGFVPVVLLPKASRKALAGESPAPILLAALGVVLAMSGFGLLGYYLFPERVIGLLAGPAFVSGAHYLFLYGLAMVLLAALNTVVYFKIGIHRFDFVPPLAICAVGEVAGIVFFHASIREIITVLIVGNALALGASCYRINVPNRTLARVQPEAA